MNSSDEDSRSIFHILLSYFMIFKEIDGFTIYIPPFSKKTHFLQIIFTQLVI